MPPKQIVIFDGVCNLCSSSVNFIIKHDPHAKFNFASAQSSFGKKLLRQHNIDPKNAHTILLIAEGDAYIKSDAALKIAQQLHRYWKHLALLTLVPKPIRDAVYSIIANNRYRWFGKKQSCMIPTQNIRDRFLE